MIDELADNVVIVLLAYIAAFLPWTVVSSTDFINASWRPFCTIRRDAIHNLLFALIPAGYIIFYIVLQAHSGDFKELFAATVALLFSILHAARTIIALLQLYCFRRWALNSIAYLRAVGIPYRPTFQSLYHPDSSTDEQIVDHLLINETIIDNQLFHGILRVSFKYSFLVFKLPPSSEQRGFFYDRAFLIFSVCSFPFLYLFDVFCHLFKIRTRPTFEVIPFRPKDVWISWSTAFAAQGLQDWFQNMSVLENPDRRLASAKLPPLHLYQQRRDYFAGQVLSSAALHFWPRLLPSADDVPTPMLWSIWPISSGVANAIPSKTDFLFYAMTNPSIFPFKCPHTEGSVSESERTYLMLKGYRPLAGKMQRFSDTVPPKFGDMEQFDPYVLEWFAIFLHLGSKILDTKFMFPAQLSPLPMGRMIESADMDKETLDDVSDVGFENLSLQLGFHDHTNGHLRNSDEEDVFANAALPFGTGNFSVVAEKNIVAWRVSELVDTWIALLSGSQLTRTCDTNCPLCNQNVSMRDRLEKAHADEGKSHASSADVLSKNGQMNLETRRLERQFGSRKQTYWHLEQTLTFMGFDMEFVRSQLASWVQNFEVQAAKPETWQPSLHFRDVENMCCTLCIPLGKLSEELSTALKVTGKELLSRRCVQVRLHWEVMEILKERTSIKNGPDCLEMMMMCILSFPALVVELVIKEEDLPSAMVSLEENGLLKLQIEKPGVEHISVMIEPRGSPQPLSLNLKLQLGGEDHGLVKMSIVKHNGTEGDDVFEWQLWRDCFLARLQALRKWQVSHNMASVPVHQTGDDLTQGMLSSPRYYLGQLESFDIWLGWQPFRSQMCLFELRNPSFLHKLNHSCDVTTAFRKGGQFFPKCQNGFFSVIETTSIPRDQISKSCLMIMEILAEREKGPVFNASVGTISEITSATIQHAKLLVAQSPDNFERAIMLLKSSAVGLGSVAAVFACVDLLTSSDFTHASTQSAIRTIDDHLNLFEGAGVRKRVVDGGHAMRKLLSLYEKWLLEAGYAHHTIHVFCKFVGWMMWIGPAENLQLAVSSVRRIFLHTRQYELLHMLAIGKEIESMHNGNKDHRVAQESALWFEYLQRATSEGGISSANNSLSWFQLQAWEDSDNLLEQITLEESHIT